MKTPELRSWRTLHGYLYLAYLVTAADLARRARWRLGRIMAWWCAGFVPFLAFIIEHRVYRQMQAEWAAEAAAAPGVRGRLGGRAARPTSPAG